MHAHHSASRSSQRGLSFIGVIFVGLLAVAAFAIGGQSVPIFLEYHAIGKAAAKAAKEGNLCQRFAPVLIEPVPSTIFRQFRARIWK